MGCVNKNHLKLKNILIERELHDQVKEFCKESGWTMSNLVMDVLVDMLDKWDGRRYKEEEVNKNGK